MLRRAFQGFVAVETVMLFAIILVAGGAGLAEMGLSWLPRILAGVAIALALASMLPIATRALGTERVFAWLVSTRLVRDGIDAHRPFELAATLSALWLSVALRLPGWLGSAVPSGTARFEADLAADGPAKTLWVWFVVTALATAALALVIAFTALSLREAFVPVVRDRASAAGTTFLWNVLATGVLLSAELPDLFTGQPPEGPGDLRFWIDLVLALALARRVLVLVVMRAGPDLARSLDDLLAARALSLRVPRRATLLGLALVLATHFVLEPWLGVASSAAVIVVCAGPLALLLERANRRAAPAPSGS